MLGVKEIEDNVVTKIAPGSLQRREKMLDTLNRIALVLLTRREKSFDTAMTDGLDLVTGIADIDRMSVFRNIKRADGLHLSQIYRWRKDAEGTVDVWEELKDVPYAAIAPQMGKILASGKSVGGSVSMLPDKEIFKRFGCVTVLIIPVFDDGKFWGVTLFERMRERNFSAREADALHSVSAMLATAIIRNEEAKMMCRANEQVQVMLDAVPLAVTMWDKNLNVIDCSQNTISLLGFTDKQDALERFLSSVPAYQKMGGVEYHPGRYWRSKSARHLKKGIAGVSLRS